MANKILSKGTLSLRFMQNAQRAKQLEQVELDKAAVRDDAEWHVSESVRAAWGVGRATSPKSQITYESSYIPFILSSEESMGPLHPNTVANFANSSNPGPGATDEVPSSSTLLKVQGRRLFKSGKEIPLQEDAPVRSPQPPETETKRTFARPTHISGSYTGKDKTARGKGKSAKDAIFDTSGTGVDLPKPSRSLHTEDCHGGVASEPVHEPMFLKPAGVDSPSDRAGGEGASAAPMNMGNSSKSESRPSNSQKRDRVHDAGSERLDGEQKKRKKKKSVTQPE